MKFWIDTDTYETLKFQLTTTYLGGSQSGSIKIHTSTLASEELKDASDFAADLFTFNLPAGYSLDVSQYPNQPAASTATAEPASGFVPAGKVRHLVITHETQGDPQSSNTWTEDIWLSNGQNHPIMKKTGIMPGLTTLIDDNVVWSYGSPFGNTVYKTAYDEKHFDEFIPNKQLIDEMLKQSNTHFVSTGTLDGHPVMFIESINNTPASIQITNADKPVVEFAHFSDGVPVAIGPATESARSGSMPTITLSNTPDNGVNEVIDYRLWIDSQTYQILKQEYTNRFLKSQSGGNVVTYTRKITLDEVKDASAFPADLFTYTAPDGASVVDAYHVFAPRLPLPANSVAKSLPTVTQVSSEEPAPRMPLAQFKALYDDPATRPLIIDVRSKEAFDAGHIKGAESWPESNLSSVEVKLPRDRLIVAYCQ